MVDKPHRCWSSSPTSYLRNLDSEDLEADAFAVHYQAPPKHNENGTTSFSLIMPMLLVTGYASAPKDVADRVAEILNEVWDSFDQPDPRDERIRQLETALKPFAEHKTMAELVNDRDPPAWAAMTVKDRLAAIAANKERRDAEILAARAAMAGAQPLPLPQDVIDLVIAAREAWEQHGTSGDDLDRALERFAARVPYANQPDEVQNG